MSLVIGTELNPVLLDLFDKRITTVIIATIDSNLAPHSAPFHFVVVPDSKRLYVAICREHQTYHNLIATPKVSLEILDEGDIAVCIKGKARVIRQTMDADYSMAVVEINIEEVRRDNSSRHFVSQGIRIRHKSEIDLLNSKKIFLELTQISQN